MGQKRLLVLLLPQEGRSPWALGGARAEGSVLPWALELPRPRCPPAAPRSARAPQLTRCLSGLGPGRPPPGGPRTAAISSPVPLPALAQAAYRLGDL